MMNKRTKEIKMATEKKGLSTAENLRKYRIHWVTPDFPRIRGPVWDVNKKLAEKKLKEKGVT
jgi:hypothetical protein